MIKALWVAAPVSLVLVLAGCEVLGGGVHGCTLVDCMDQVSFRVSSSSGPVTSFTGSFEREGTSVAFECPQPSSYSGIPEYRCSEDLLIIETPATGSDHAKLSIDTGAGESFSGDVELDFEPAYPNGEECGQVCSQHSSIISVE